MDFEDTVMYLSRKYGLDPIDIITRYNRYKNSALFKEKDYMKFLEVACVDLVLLKTFNDGVKAKEKQTEKIRYQKRKNKKTISLFLFELTF